MISKECFRSRTLTGYERVSTCNNKKIAEKDFKTDNKSVAHNFPTRWCGHKEGEATKSRWEFKRLENCNACKLQQKISLFVFFFCFTLLRAISRSTVHTHRTVSKWNWELSTRIATVASCVIIAHLHEKIAGIERAQKLFFCLFGVMARSFICHNYGIFEKIWKLTKIKTLPSLSRTLTTHTRELRLWSCLQQFHLTETWRAHTERSRAIAL